MSFANAKAQLVTALKAVTWTIPASASGITNPVLNTAFGTVSSAQFAGEEASIPASLLPYCRVVIPDLDEARKTDLGDFASYKEQRFPAHVFVYQAGQVKDWQGLDDFFDAVVDGTLAYFRNHSAPQGQGPVTSGQNDLIRGWGLHMRVRRELPDQYGALLVFRATLAIDVINYIV